MGKITTPSPITEQHVLDEFDCGNTTLNEWLQHRALNNETHGASRTFVVCDNKKHVIGYYSLAVGSVDRQDSPGKVRRNMPEPIPVMILGRLAIDKNWQHAKIGKGLLKDAIMRSLSVSKNAGLRALLVHAISDEARKFYQHCGFFKSPTNSMTLMITMKDALQAMKN